MLYIVQRADAKTFEAIQSSLSSSSSSSSTHSNIKPKLHLISCDWITKLKSFLETGLESDKPLSIENKSLLQCYNPHSKTFLVVNDDADIDNMDTRFSSEGESTSELGAASDSSTGVMVGSTPSNSATTSPASSEITTSSFVVVHSDAQMFVKNESTSPTTVTFDDLGAHMQQETSCEMDDRTKRRMKWAKIKEEQEKQPKSDDEDTSMSNTQDIVEKPNILKSNIFHRRDFYAIGDNTWMLLRSKFGFDIDIELPLTFSVVMGRLLVDDIQLTIPENGLFDWSEELFKSYHHTLNTGTDSSDEDLVCSKAITSML